ncbi:MAG: PKD domain-containing protein [Bacteroidales bacterium]|nr:PKD domain-containing protein [Bacteroidales bacterium]
MKNIRYFILSLAVIVCGSVFAQESQKDLEQLMKNRGEYYFSLTVQKPTEIQAISDLCSVDGTDGKTVVAYANQSEFDNLLRQGYQPTLMTPPSMREQPLMHDASRATYDWDSYLTYDEYEAMMQQFATDHPDRCTYLELGTLASGRKMMGARLGRGETDGKPKFLYTSTMHGDEVTGMILMLRLIDEFCTSEEKRITDILDSVDLFIFPCTNPDGTYHGGNNTVYGAIRYNGNNIDLNRHFPDFDDGPHPDGQSYYQDECQWMMDLAQEHLFTMSANYHGGAEVMNYPWDTYQPLHADDAWWQLVCHEYADLTHEVSSNYMTDYNNGIINGYQWYTITGSRQDYMNYYAQCREVTIECSNDKTPNASQLPNFWNINHNSMLTYIEQVLNGVQGIVTDSITSEPISGALVTVSGHDHHGSEVSTHTAGDFYRPIKGGSYTFIISKDGYCPRIFDVTIADGEMQHFDIQLVPGSCMVPSFSASATQVPLGGSVNFTDGSFGEISAWSWTFEGGTPATSNQQNPTVTYNEVGDFGVTLTITNANGDSQTLTREDYIHVRETYNMQNGTFETCNALFYDAGGPNNNYGNNQDYTMTFKPATEGSMIRATFSDFSTEANYDYLYIYDGSSTNATMIGQYDGSNSPGEVTATNGEGALTFRFTSDQGVNSGGWVATISCVGNHEPMIINVSANPAEINEGESTRLEAIVMGGAGNYTWLWEPAETLDDPTSCCPVATPVAPETTYKVVVTDADGNTTSGEVTVTIKNWSISENPVEPFVYPNPSKGTFTIHLAGTYKYIIFNSFGQKVMSGEAFGEAEINASHLAEGVYVLQIVGDDIRTEKIVIEK